MPRRLTFIPSAAMSRILTYLPELTGDEQIYAARLMTPMTDVQAQQFAHAYRARRKDPSTVLLLTLLGLFSIAGIQRFFVGEIGMGLLYLFTGGLCLVGTIIDAVNHQKIAASFNMKQADEVASMLQMQLGGAPAPPRLS